MLSGTGKQGVAAPQLVSAGRVVAVRITQANLVLMVSYCPAEDTGDLLINIARASQISSLSI
jgi:hypothetical protein